LGKEKEKRKKNTFLDNINTKWYKHNKNNNLNIFTIESITSATQINKNKIKNKI